MHTTSQQSTSVRALLFFGTILVLGLLSGCANYQLGSSAEIPFKSLYIKPATNHSFAPQAQPIISAQLRETFIRDARVKLVAHEQDADAVLYVDLTEYDSNAAARNSNDTVRANSFNIRLSAEISLYDQHKGSYLFQERAIHASTIAYTGNPQTEGDIISYQQSERQAMPLLARELARQITDEVLSPW